MVNREDSHNLRTGIVRHIWYKGIEKPPKMRIHVLLSGLEGKPEREFYKSCIKGLIEERYLDLDGDFDNETGYVIINERGQRYLNIHEL